VPGLDVLFENTLTMQKRIFIAILGAVAALLLASCGTTYQTEVTRFHQLPKAGAGQTFTISAPKKTFSLETQQHLGQLAQGLTEYGWKQSTGRSADYKVAVEYGITDGKTVQGVRTIYGQTGGGTTTYHSGTANAYGSYGSYSSGSYSGTSHTPATYGVVGAVPTSHTVYGRYLYVIIMNRSGKTVLEGKCFSIGTSGNLSEVVPRMIDSFLSDFPGVSGKTKTYSKN
jgi:hypothetical protein